MVTLSLLVFFKLSGIVQNFESDVLIPFTHLRTCPLHYPHPLQLDIGNAGPHSRTGKATKQPNGNFHGADTNVLKHSSTLLLHWYFTQPRTGIELQCENSVRIVRTLSYGSKQR